jgi:3-oxoacid CoA-transferase B subunit
MPSHITENRSIHLFLIADLCYQIIVAMNHTDKNGNSKILEQCRLPITGKGVIDMIITELAVFTLDRQHGGGLTLSEIAEGVTIDQLKKKTAAKFQISNNLKTF